MRSENRKDVKFILLYSILFATIFGARPVVAADLFGGGAYFPARGYVGGNFEITSPAVARLSRNTMNVVSTTPIATLTPPDTVFARFSSDTGNKISYCQTGSDFGKFILIGLGSEVGARGECGSYVSSPAGFSSTFVSPNYIGIDLPFSQADINSFNSGPRIARGLWQIPAMVGSVALTHHFGLGFSDLTTEEVCRIFSARITNWSSIPGSGSSAPIQVVFRADDNGTSLAFTSYLATTCNGKFGIPIGYFKPNQSFTAAVPALGSNGPLYAAATAMSGNRGVVNYTSYTSASIGYAEYQEVAARGTEFATIDGVSPAGLPPSISIVPPLTGQVLNASNVPVSITGGSLANPACVRLTNPNTRPAGVSYPILVYTYLAGYRDLNGSANATALRGLLGYFLASQANRPVLPAGLAYLDGSATYRASVQNTISTCIL